MDNLILRMKFWPVLCLALLGGLLESLAETPKLIWSRDAHANHLHTVIYDSSGRMVISAAHDRLIKAFRAADGKPLWTLNARTPYNEPEGPYDNGIIGAAITRDGSRVAGAARNYFTLWNFREGWSKRIRTNQGFVNALDFNPAGTHLAAAGDDGSVQIFNAHSGGYWGKLRFHTGRTKILSFSPDGNYLAIGGDDGTVAIVSMQNWRLVARLRRHDGEVNATAWSPNMAHIVTGASDNTIRLWRVGSWSQARVTHVDYPVHALAFNPSGSKFASGGEGGGTLDFWRTSDGARLKSYEVESTRWIAFSPNGTTFAYGGDPRTVNVARVP